ncbi:benomyl/methotrexate resistance protein [Xylaria flabelliformis]|nr:benomyl/methotrexate resistance protein [Xylaria flabelliformis]
MAFIIQRRALAKQVQYQLEQIDVTKGLGMISDGSATTSTTAIDIEKAEATIPSRDAYLMIPGITRQVDRDGEWYYDVGWVDEDDEFNPKRWSTATRLGSTFLVCVVAFFATSASSIDSVVIGRAAAEFGVSHIVEALATGIYLVGFGTGALLASPLSELVGRQPVYVVSLLVFEGWTIGSALSPNIAAQLIFRFLMGVSASAPLTVAGGSISDMWSPLERTFAFPFYAIPGFGGAVFGPVVGTWIGNDPDLTWRWVEWLTLILTGSCLVLLFLFKRETFAPRILKIKAAAFRRLTGNPRFKTSKEASDASDIWPILKRNFGRPFILCFEPIVLSFTVYVTINYIILFTFLDGYPYIFAGTYGISENLSNTIFLGLLVGILLPVVLLPWTYRSTVQQLERDGDDGSGKMLNRENRLYFAMIGAPIIPIGLFWMAWTDYSFISIWSPILASVLIGFGIVCVFMSANMYIIDCYEAYAASALTFNALTRYIAAGGFTIIGIPLYGNLGTHWTLTLLGVVSALALPIPFVLFKWGPKVRARSKWAF